MCETGLPVFREPVTSRFKLCRVNRPNGHMKCQTHQPPNFVLFFCKISVTSDLSVRTCGRVAKNSTRGRRPSVLFLVTRPQASTDKFDVTRRNHALIVLLYVLRMREQCLCMLVYLVHYSSLFIES